MYFFQETVTTILPNNLHVGGNFFYNIDKSDTHRIGTVVTQGRTTATMSKRNTTPLFKCYQHDDWWRIKHVATQHLQETQQASSTHLPIINNLSAGLHVQLFIKYVVGKTVVFWAELCWELTKRAWTPFYLLTNETWQFFNSKEFVSYFLKVTFMMFLKIIYCSKTIIGYTLYYKRH